MAVDRFPIVQRVTPTRVELAAPLSEQLHADLSGIPSFRGLVLIGSKTYAEFDGHAASTDEIDAAIATGAAARASVPPEPAPDYAAEYALAKTDADRLSVIARKLGLAT